MVESRLLTVFQYFILYSVISTHVARVYCHLCLLKGNVNVRISYNLR